MILVSLPIGLVFALVVYFGAVRMRMGRRNQQSWDSLMSRLHPIGCLRVLSIQFPWKEGLSSTPDEAWEQMQGVSSLWALYRDAGVLLEIADFAARNSDSVDPILLQSLRHDAIQIRLHALIAIAQTLWGHANEGVRIQVFSVLSMYTGMASRTAELLQQGSSSVLPQFVAAM